MLLSSIKPQPLQLLKKDPSVKETEVFGDPKSRDTNRLPTVAVTNRTPMREVKRRELKEGILRVSKH